jgi:diguanylate cyclase (GGDEF)-like protein
MNAPAKRHSAEIVPLADRLRYTQMMRLLAAAIVGGTTMLVPGTLEYGRALLLLSTCAYLMLTLLGYVLWRFVSRQAVMLFGALLIVDGIYLAWAAEATGGAASPLRYLIILHLVAVALLASYRTGLKLALWDSLLLWATYQLHSSGVLDQPEAARRLAGSDLDHLAFFATMVWIATIATATFSAVNERELRRRRYDSEALAAMASRLEDAHEPLDVSEVIMESVADAFAFERGVVLVAGEEDDRGALFAMAEAGDVNAAAAQSPVPEDSVVARVMRSRRTVLLARAAADDPWLAALVPVARNLLLVPLSAERRSMGVLVVEHSLRSGSRVERRVVEAVERFASQGSLALRNAWLLLALRRSAETDELTGIANRRTFDETLAREIDRAERSGEELSLVLFDIDHFKTLNDTHGHQLGDVVLRRAAQSLAEGARPYDVVCRYGGEEFAVVLPRTGRTDAAPVAERLRRRVLGAEGQPAVTLSAGVATYPSDAASGAALVAQADAALYASKAAGRDRLTSCADLDNDAPDAETARSQPL